MRRSYRHFAVLEQWYAQVLQAMSRRGELASGGGVNKWTPCVNTSSPGLLWVTAHVTVSHMVPGTRGIHRETRRKCRDSESEECVAT